MAMSAATDLLIDGFGRVHDNVHAVLDGLGASELSFRPGPEANSIAWLIWHLTRVQDDHVADLEGAEQVWTSAGWSDRLGLPFDPAATGYGQSGDDVGAVAVESGALLAGYHDAVFERTIAYVRTLTDADLSRVVDENWTPPVTLAVRLVSVIDDDAQHVGQAAYLRGLTEHG
jgi:uncharacterized damage-inducible protein DinB